MDPTRTARAVAALALGIGALVCGLARSTPLIADSTSPAWAVPSPSAADLVLTDTHLELFLQAPGAGYSSQLLGPRPAYAPVTGGALREFDFGQRLDPGSRAFAETSQDALRGLVTTERAGGTAHGTPARGRHKAANDSPSLDLGRTTNEWIRGSIREVMASALDLNSNDHGQDSFSFLGMGDLGATASADGSEFALVTRDKGFNAARPQVGSALGASTSHGGRNPDPSWDFGGTPSASREGREGPGVRTSITLVKQALNLALEIATHPISFFVYVLICAYALLWAVLSGRARRRRRRTHTGHDRTHRSSRSARSQAPSPAPEPVAHTIRKRVRLRRRRHRTRPSTHRA